VSTVDVGDAFEDEVFETLGVELKAGQLGIKPECATLIPHPSYYSRDREKDIVFDIGIEVRRPGSTDPFLRVIFECKTTGRPVSVDDVEEFWAKVTQVSGLNVKAVMVTGRGFQAGAVTFAASKSIGLVRYSGELDWILERTARAGRYAAALDAVAGFRALTSEVYRGRAYPFFCCDLGRYTNSIAEFIRAVAEGGISDPGVRSELTCDPPAQRSLVRYMRPEEIAKRAEDARNAAGYASGPVSLDAICAQQGTATGLTVRIGEPPGPHEKAREILGRIRFDPLEIVTYAREGESVGRQRFTLAHELGHLLLGHGEYMQMETCEGRDLDREPPKDLDDEMIQRLDWQANQFASFLLLPEGPFVSDFLRLAEHYELRDHGYGLFYVDNQRCNYQPYYAITAHLMTAYEVSRTVVDIRLKALGYLKDERTPPSSRPWGLVA
jgi:hypothetical protein